MSTITKVSAFAALVFSGMLSASVSTAGPNALTWSASELPGVTDVPGQKTIHLGCHSPSGSCDPYVGDTPKTEVLHIACFVPDTLPEPTSYATYFDDNWTGVNHAINNWRFYHGWSGGYIGLSKRIAADNITSKAMADAHCQSPVTGLGVGSARMLEHHDNGVGGWGIGAEIYPTSISKNKLKFPSTLNHERFWVWIDDQNSNPWN